MALGDVREWLQKAELDLRVARHDLEGGFVEAAAFHSHQAIEKALKAVFLEKFGVVKKVHDLSFLAREVKLPKKLLVKCIEITPFYLESRYPGLGGDVSFEEARQATSTAKEVIEWVNKNI